MSSAPLRPLATAPTAAPGQTIDGPLTTAEGCSHEACGCLDVTMTVEGRSFCSDLCADAALASHPLDAPCPCLHPECTPTGKGG